MRGQEGKISLEKEIPRKFFANQAMKRNISKNLEILAKKISHVLTLEKLFGRPS